MALLSRRTGRRVLAVGALSAVIMAVPVALGSPWEDSVRAGSLGHSLANVIGNSQRPSCRSDAPGAWTCAVPDPASGRLAEYRLTAYGRCWEGHRAALTGSHLPVAVRGCVGMWDQLRLADRL
jgi:hypothetical protein